MIVRAAEAVSRSRGRATDEGNARPLSSAARTLIARPIRPFGRGERPGVDPLPPDRVRLAAFFAGCAAAGLLFAHLF
jgi:hypothetical protein